MSPVTATERRRYLPLAVAAGAVVLMSTVAYTGRVPAFVAAHGIDKVLHATMTFTLTLLLARALRGRALLAAVLVMVPVAIDEYMQRFSPSRSSDWSDLVADFVGVALALGWRSALRRRDG